MVRASYCIELKQMIHFDELQIETPVYTFEYKNEVIPQA